MNEMEYQQMDGFYRGAAQIGQPPTPDDRPALKELTRMLRNNEIGLVDLICGGTLALAVILGLCFWETVSDVLFYKLWFPLLALGERLLVLLLFLFVLWLFLRKSFYRY